MLEMVFQEIYGIRQKSTQESTRSLVMSVSPVNLITQRERSSLLISFVGQRDPWPSEESQVPGPILSILEARPEFTDILLLHTGEKAFEERAEVLREKLERQFGVQSGGRVRVAKLHIPDPTHYETILWEIRRALVEMDVAEHTGPIYICAAPGTQQIHACWLLLTASGELPARILHIREQRHVQPEQELITEINPKASAFPRILPHIVAEVSARIPAEEIRVAREKIGMVGEDAGFLRVLEDAASYAPYDCSVLILGPNGSGKEYLARFIHLLSDHRQGPLVAVNCGAVPENLFEAEFFGHRKGAFTGAERERQGYFLEADRGTLFLDEIGELPLSCQAKLLRVVQEKKVRPLGGSRDQVVDVRIIAATNRNLDAALREGAFREDLYYRIGVAPLRVPGLNERPGDIALLAQHLLHEFNRINNQVKYLSPEALVALKRNRWKGNIRELDGVITVAAMRARGDEIRETDLSLGGLAPVMENGLLPVPHEGFILKDYLKQTHNALMDKALELAEMNRSKAARMLGISSQAVQQYLKNKSDTGRKNDECV
jgi:DNA-binding NtrC family response regulator